MRRRRRRWPDVVVAIRWSADVRAVPGSVVDRVCADCGRYIVTAPSSVEVLAAMAPAVPLLLCTVCASVPNRLDRVESR